MMSKKVLVYPLLALILVAGLVHATVQNRANQHAQLMVTELIELFEDRGINISVGKLTVQPYSREVTARDLVIEMNDQPPHHVGVVRLTDIEFNQAQDFILAMRVDVEQVIMTVTPQMADEIQPEVIWQTLQSLGMKDGQLAQHQSIYYRYNPELAQLQLRSTSRVHHPDDIQKVLYEFDVSTEFTQIPDLEQMLADLRTTEEQSNLSMRWLSTGLKTFSAVYVDKGWWPAYRSTAASLSGVTEQHFQYASAEQVATWLWDLPFLPASAKQTLIEASTDFIAADAPQFHFSVRALPPEGVNIPMAFMAAVMSPNAMENFFEFDLSLSMRENE
ncbi:hypothetical protein MPL1_10457 [Methylophaga lonarensis MPL]|uniref:Uncharacterized protein n=1 Tax=Methylophaga lonarensis MPL TaxID=1286106 RepID=M7PPH2_9GAMM|nr:hypothetical protein [Methylophaga lonarensis]EMR12349.1 hypothetical protein MPL1_10457 [Methylophaga lonarensis MPL]